MRLWYNHKKPSIFSLAVVIDVTMVVTLFYMCNGSALQKVSCVFVLFCCDKICCIFVH